MMVSRETGHVSPPISRHLSVAPPAPLVHEKLSKFAALLQNRGIPRGFLGPNEASNLWSRHIINCFNLTVLLKDGAKVCDVGSGAGLPGLVLAIARPDCDIFCIESLGKRVDFMKECCSELGIKNVTFQKARIENVTGSFTHVTSRALAPLPKLLGWVHRILGADGDVLAIKGESVYKEICKAQVLASDLKFKPPEVFSMSNDLGAATTVVRYRKQSQF